MKAANQIVRIVEDLLSSRRIQQCPIHIVPALFSAMGMHAIDICSDDVVREQLGNVKVRLSMIALQELKSTWPVSGWIFLLFTKIVRQVRDKSYLFLQENPSSSSRAHSSSPNLAESATATSDNVKISQRCHNIPGESTLKLSQPKGSQVNPSRDPIEWDPSNAFMPFNFAVDWSDTVDESLWNGPDLDFWSIPQADRYS